MKLTIIVPDASVYVDEISYSELDLNTIPKNVHALQWNDSVGHIEFNDGTLNESITELPTWANDSYDAWLVNDKLDKQIKAQKIKEQEEEAAIAADKERQLKTPLANVQKLDIIRMERNKRLFDCDWTQLLDAPSSVNKEAWAVYRQELRDLPNQSSLNLDMPNWPTLPNN
jgi:hypothetical protein